eukprot:NODE_4527_length_774_cov_47.296754_g4368_i0.p1 GENE.NODE_4527_length_774_cov_47.296754_g4368_i0~~NODE_4527_length_774_cov_47.296754_g4368_i0.p1  ORF type:complete len:213 (+),score=79.68 NODE_4527_length_774_cov_47.296754_g4368_i0:60-698(+)
MTDAPELNGHNQHFLTKSFVKGYCVSKADQELFEKLFGNNTKTIEWLQRLAAHPTFNVFEGPAPADEDFELFGDDDETPAPKKAAAAEEDFDLFGDETEEEQKAREEDAAQKAAAAKATKKVVIGKSSLVIDIKPWDDETDMKELEAAVRAIQKEGLFWGASKFVEIAFGLKKLQIMLTIEDDKVGSDDLEDWIGGLEDFVQSMDIVVWNKV